MNTAIKVATAGLAIAGLASVGFAASANAEPTASPTPKPAGKMQKVDAAVVLLPFFAHTTDAQRTCLAQQGLTAPKGKLTDAQQADLSAAVIKAAATCGVKMPKADTAKIPGRWAFGFARLTADQQACVAKLQITRPIGRLTDAQRETLRTPVNEAAATCGIKGK